MFSTPELQKLISGDAADVDIEDLRSVLEKLTMCCYLRLHVTLLTFDFALAL